MAREKKSDGAASGVKGLSATEGQATFFGAKSGAAQLQMFRSLADHSRDFIGICDLDFRPFYVNEAGWRLVGLGSMEEACAVRVQEFFFPEDQRFITEEFFPKVLREGTGEVEIRFRHFKTGAALWMIYNVFQVRDARGQVSGYATVSREITERKRAEETVRESEELFRALSATAPVGIAVSSKGRFIHTNPEYERMTGYGPGELVGKEASDLYFDPEDRSRWARVLKEKGMVRDFETKWKRKDGTPIWVSISVTGIAYGSGEAVIGTAQDITERKRTEAALRESEAKYRQLFESIDEGFCILEMIYDESGKAIDYRFLEANPAFVKLTGIKQDEKRTIRTLDPNTEDFWFETYSRIARTGVPERFIHSTVFLPGWLEVYAFKFGEGDKVAVLFSVITERKKAESKLRESEERLRLALEAADLGTWDLDLVTGKAVRSLRHDQIFGYTDAQEEWTLEHALRHILPEDRQKVLDAHAPAAGKTEMYVEARFRRADGDIRWVMSMGRFCYGPDGRPVRLTGVCADITDRRRAEEALRQRTEELRTVLDTTPAAIFLAHDAECRKITGNRAAQKLVELPPEANISKSAPAEERPTRWQEMRDGVAIEPDSLPMQRAVRGEEVRDYEMDLVFREGSVKSVLGNATPIRGEDGRPRGGVAVLMDITKRKQVEAALRQNGQDLEEAQRLAHIGSWHWDAKTDVTTGSDELLRIYGFEPGKESMPDFNEQRGRCYPVEEWERVNAAVQRTLQTGIGYELDVRALRKGSEIWVTTRSEVVRDGQNQVIGLRGTVQDITERKRAEQALEHERERLSVAFKAGRMGAYDLEIPSKRLWWSPEVYAVFGVSEGSFTPSRESFGALLHPEDREEFWRHFDGAIAANEVFVHEFRIVRPDGELRWIANLAETEFREGQAVRHFGIAMDITERKRAEESVRESEQRFRSLADGTPVMIWVHDGEGGLRFVNRAWREFFGKTLEQATGENWKPLVHAEDHAGYVDEFLRCHAERREFYAQARVQRHDGQWRWMESFGAPRFSGTGEYLGMAGSSVDITTRKEAEGLLARDKEELERSVAERTAKLHELVGELEHFSYTITHDLKSPLRAMRGFAEIAGTMCERTEVKECLGRISTSAERMDRLIADALNYSRSVRQELPLEDVDAGALLRGMMDSYPELQPEKARIQVEGRLPVVLANEAGLTQCFSNLLGNAVKFVKRGERPEIRVWAEGANLEIRNPKWENRSGKPESGWVRIWVEDKGIGIGKEMLPRVFDMFSRGSKDYDGTGIGLALVRKVVQRMGGRVGVESEEGKGSRFWIELKCGEALAEASAFAEAAAEKAARPGTVLYVEDEESDAMFMELAFAGNGLGERLRVVGDGRAAINYLSGSGEYGDREKYPVPAVVLLDLNLPHVPGFEVLQWMRNHPDFAKTPVVVFSSSTREDDRVKARELGANEFVSKPSSAAKFGEVVEGLRRRWMGKIG